jgi:hypothetical protein
VGGSDRESSGMSVERHDLPVAAELRGADERVSDGPVRRRAWSAEARILAAGLVAALALVAYLAVAFASSSNSAVVPTTSTPAPQVTVKAETLGPWTSVNAEFARLRGGTGTRVALVVTPASLTTYGARVPTIVGNPVSGDRVLVGFSLKGSSEPVRIEIPEFASGTANRYLSNRLLRVTSRWRHYLVVARVERGHWTGLGLGVYRSGTIPLSSWFAIRDLTVVVQQ